MKAFTVLFLAHLIGDFYLQPNRLAKWKAGSFWGVLVHSLIYAAAQFASLILLGGGMIWAVTIASATHLLIDGIKHFAFDRRNGGRPDKRVFCTDQALHLAIVFLSALWMTANFELCVPPYAAEFEKLIGMNAYSLLSYTAMLAAVMKPANIFIRVMISGFVDNNEDKAKGPVSGRMIGSLERILVIILLLLKQYASVAIVFTAKSIARFKLLDDREFAEYYILGTLLSAVTAAGVFVMLKYFGA